jgi:pyridoxine kinase
MSGYLPTVAHVEAVAAIVQRVEKARTYNVNDMNTWPAPYLCDPVLGDDPNGLYIPADAAAAIRERLLPLSDVLTPNRFELSWLTGRDVASVDDALAAARETRVANVVATSVPLSANRIANVNTWPKYHHVNTITRLPNVPHGTGDLFSALYLAGWITHRDADVALRDATDGVAAAIDLSRGRDELVLPARPR